MEGRRKDRSSSHGEGVVVVGRALSCAEVETNQFLFCGITVQHVYECVYQCDQR
jgi:hypothetical protein